MSEWGSLQVEIYRERTYRTEGRRSDGEKESCSVGILRPSELVCW